MISITICYSATSGSSVADCGTPCTVDMGNVRQTLIRRLRQSQCIVQLAAGQQPSIRGDGSAAKLQPYTAVKTDRGAGVGAFTHWVPPEWVRYQELKQSITTSLALMISITICYSATSGSSVADCGKPCRVDMGNVRQTLIRRLRQSQCIVQLAAGQQPSVRGDGSAAKLQPYTAVKTDRGAGVGAFTHWVPPEWVRYQDLK